MRLLWAFVLVGAAVAQETARATQAAEPPAGLVWSGKPLEVKPRCTPEDLTALGLSCSEDEPCEMYLELATAETVGNRLLVAGNLHTSSATLESVLLASDDGGRTWTEPHARIHAAHLDRIQFIDFETGWVAGQTLTTLPRDPFFLLSSDGGKTWRRRPVFSETRVSTIDTFWFDSKTSGTMTVDRVQAAETGMRYELYESMTGGESWTLRQVGPKPIPMKRAATESAVRLRTDAAAKAYRLERRAGEKWQTLATFAIRAGECRPAGPPPLPEPPEPAVEEPTSPAPPARKPPSLKPKRN